jgi:hypothetical protein
MMNDLEFWPRIRLVSIEGNTRSPLRRTLARTAWQRSPVALIRYEPDPDRLLIQLIDAPTVAEAVPGGPGDLDVPALSRGEPAMPQQGGQFTGFDGTEPDAWPTTIAVLGFSRCRDSDNPRIRLQRELCGDHIWTAARTAANKPQRGLLEVPLGQDETEFLIRRWHAIVTIPSAAGVTGPEVNSVPVEGPGADPDNTTPEVYRPRDRAATLRGPAGQPNRESR